MNKGKRNIVLVILSMIAGLVYLTPFLRFSFYDQMAQALQLTDVQIGTIGSVYGLFNVLGYLPSGFLAEKFNTKKLLVLSTLAMCLVTLWYSTYPGFTSLVVIHALYGVFSVGTFWSPYLKAIRNLGTSEEQGRIFGMSEGIRGVAQTAVAFACLGAMSMFATVAAGFRAALFINAAAFAVLMVAVIILVPDFDRQPGAEDQDAAAAKNDKNIKHIVAATLKSSSTWICIFVIMCGYTIWATVNGYIGTYCTRVLLISDELSSTLSIIRSFFIVFIAGFTGGFIMDRFRSKGKGMFFAYLSIAICVAGIFLTSRAVAVCIVITVLLAYFVNVVKATYWSIMDEAGIPLARTGMATGVISLIALTPDIFAPAVVSRFLHYGETLGNIEIGFNMMLAWLGVWSVLGIIAALILKKRAERKALAAPDAPGAALAGEA
ncbi:MFS transporter [Deltaproteobacteria bacterium Smac51]|nr:MFS transporter [Deltaproteobacteria bacterium Smac51]